MGMCLMLSSAVTMKMMRGKGFRRFTFVILNSVTLFFAVDSTFDISIEIDIFSKFEY